MRFNSLKLFSVTENTLKLITARLSTESEGCNIPATKSLLDIPSPSTLPLIGQLHHFLPFGIFGKVKHALDMTSYLNDRFGPIARVGPILRNPITVFLFDTNDVEYVLRNENTMPHRAGFDSLQHYRQEVNKDHYQGMTGLITDHGEKWKQFRSIVNPIRLQPKTIRMYTSSIDQVAQDMVKRLKKIRNPDNTIEGDFEIEMNKWSLESIALVGLGQRLGCLEDDLPKESTAMQLIQCVRDCFEMMDALDFRPSPWKYFATPTYKKGMAIYEKQYKLSEIYINKAVENMKNRQSKDVAAEDKSVLEKLLEIDSKVALIMATDMLFAGVDTAAHTMMSLLYHLAVNPDKQDTLREEIKTGVERKYLKACMRENMRLSPVVTGNMRRLTKDLKVRGYLLPKGTDIIFPNEHISRQEDQYKRAKEFLPERWLVSEDDPLHYGSAHPMATLPFGHGVRSCIGRRIAELEVETFLARVIESFEVQWQGPRPNIITKALNYMKPPHSYVFNDVK